jgi:hypothetical protein
MGTPRCQDRNRGSALLALADLGHVRERRIGAEPGRSRRDSVTESWPFLSYYLNSDDHAAPAREPLPSSSEDIASTFRIVRHYVIRES